MLAGLLVLPFPIAGASISSSMIVEMREITSVSTSPDGARAVIGICHANPQTNRREVSWVIVPVRGSGNPITIPGGDEILDPGAPGALLNHRVQWSPDGKWFFYLRRDGEQVQLWETAWDGQMTRQLTHSAADLIGLEASDDPSKLLVRLAPDRDRLRQAEENENRNGILYDEHIIGEFPLSETLPVIDRWRNVRLSDNGEWLPPGWSGATDADFDTASLKLQTPAAVTKPSTIDGFQTPKYRATAVALGRIPAGGPHFYTGQFALQLASKTGATPVVKCTLVDCIAGRITILGWSADAAEVRYLADSLEGRLGNRLPGHAAIFAWNPSRNTVRLIREADGSLYNLDAPAGFTLVPAPIVGHEIVVAYSSADQPPLLEKIDLLDGSTRVLFDPNAELRALTQGRADWHTWPTSSPYPGRGIFVLPDDYQPGHRYPAVVTSYGCGRKFLNGGSSGDDVPEFMAAHDGFIAICVDFTVREIIAREGDYSRIYPVMCSILSALIADQKKGGAVDPARIGLSGQSLGANFGAYCISRSHEFAAAAFRHGSAMERAAWELFETGEPRSGPANALLAKFHLPDPRHDPTGKWDKISTARRARHIDTPTLIQDDDLEYLNALPLWTAMREEGKVIEMYVFPKETHRLTQPIHRLVNYQRQLDWFRFWLKNEEDPDPLKQDQYHRWNRLRESSRNNRAHH